LNGARIRVLLALVLLAAGFAAWSGARDAAFLFDDHNDIEGNPRLAQAWPPWSSMAGHSRPLVVWSFALDRARGGLDPRPFHETNLAIHLAAGLLLFFLTDRILRRPPLAPRFGEAAPVLAFGTALLWLLHPLHGSVVAYAVHRYESMMGLFVLLCLALFVRGLDSPRPAPWLAGSAVAAFAAAGSKEVAIALPPIVLLFDRLLGAGSFREAFARRKAFHGAILGSALLVVLLRLRAPAIESIGLRSPLTPWDYLRSQPGVLLRYLRLSLFPHPLSIDYFDWPIARSPGEWLLPGLAVLVVVGLSLLFAFRGSVAAGVVVAAFLVLAPTSSVVPFFGELLAERRMYLPLAAVAALLVTGGWSLLSKRRGRLVAFPLLIGAAALLGLASARRCLDFRDEVGIWRQVVTLRPGNARAWSNLGSAQDRAGDFDGAERSWREAIRLSSRFRIARNNLGAALARRGLDEEAIALFREVIAFDPDDSDAWHNLGLALERRGEWSGSVEAYRRAVRLRPEVVEFRNDLAWLLATVPELPLRAPAEAVELAREVVRVIDPPRPEPVDTLATALAAAGRFDEAIREATRAELIARMAGEESLAKEIAGRRKLFAAGRPFER
jgi:Flp pilus assembly protein TadD